MSHKTYAATIVDSIVNDLLGVVEDSLRICKSAQEETAVWRKKAQVAAQPKVVLEKVASIDKTLVDETVSKLEKYEFLDPEDPQAGVKLASHLLKDPNSALLLVQRVLQFSAPAHQEGKGVEKTAVERQKTGKHSNLPEGWAEEGWDSVLTNGA